MDGYSRYPGCSSKSGATIEGTVREVVMTLTAQTSDRLGPDRGNKNFERYLRSVFGAGAEIIEIPTQHGVTVIFDVTANRRQYRERARARVPRYLEVHVDCPLEVCVERDPKGIDRKAMEGLSDTLPGLQTAYESPTESEVVVYGDIEVPERAAERILAKIIEKGYLEE